MNNTSEEIRLRYRYRDLILRGKITLSLEAAKGLVGPDCAFHLYSVIGVKKKNRETKPEGRHAAHSGSHP